MPESTAGERRQLSECAHEQVSVTVADAVDGSGSDRPGRAQEEGPSPDQAPRIEREMDALHRNTDPWGVDEHFYEARKRSLTLAALPQARYERGLELGCSIGALAAEVAGRCDELVAVDASVRACAAARQRLEGFEHARVEHAHVPEQWPAGEWDLIVISEVGYFLSAAELARCIGRIKDSLRPGGTLLACHWGGPIEGWELDGGAVHERLGAAGFLSHQGGWLDADFRLDVWSRGDVPSVAQRDGLRP